MAEDCGGGKAMRNITSQEKLYAIRFGGIMMIAGVVVLLDRFSKAWIRHHFQLGESRPITSWFYLTFVQNTGTAFGLFQGNNKALLILAFLILGALLYGARGLSERGGFWGALGVALVLGGAVGNVMDRIHYGQVIDFLDFRIWPVFNIADSAITVGTISIMVGLLLRDRPEEIR
jgi:signal peptidase II